MKLQLPLALLAAAAGGTAAGARVPPAAFEASGTAPGWQLSVSERFVGISFGPEGLPAGTTGESYLIPGIRHTRAEGMLSWQAGKGVMTISVEARPGNCAGADGTALSHHVTVRFRERILEGCGSVPAQRKRR